MRSISCLIELLVRKTPLDSETVTMTRMMRESASRMVALIDNLLDFARGRLGGGLPLTRDAGQPLETVLQTVISELNASYPNRLVETEFNFIEPVYCDRGRIAQLFSNLLGNALAYGSSDQPVRVRAISSLAGFELDVANGGDPIPEAALGHLFQPFYRSAVMHDREGLGLGLYIAREIATAHGGTLEVQSTQAETRFTFRLPAV